jgi:hypothetical protein
MIAGSVILPTVQVEFTFKQSIASLFHADPF